MQSRRRVGDWVPLPIDGERDLWLSCGLDVRMMRTEEPSSCGDMAASVSLREGCQWHVV